MPIDHILVDFQWFRVICTFISFTECLGAPKEKTETKNWLLLQATCKLIKFSALKTKDTNEFPKKIRY